MQNEKLKRRIQREKKTLACHALIGSQDSGAIKTLVANGINYITLLRKHIDKEDGFLYPIIDGHLNRSNVEYLLEKFDKIEEGIGRDKIDTMIKEIKELREKLLPREAREVQI